MNQSIDINLITGNMVAQQGHTDELTMKFLENKSRVTIRVIGITQEQKTLLSDIGFVMDGIGVENSMKATYAKGLWEHIRVPVMDAILINHKPQKRT